MSETLVGRRITVFMDGGWELSGVVRSQDPEKIILESDKKLHMIFRKKVAVLIMDIANSMEAPGSKNEAINKVEATNKVEEKEDEISMEEDFVDQDEPFPINPISYDDSSMSLPMDILGLKNLQNEEDFSISFSGSLKEESEKVKRMPKISFRSEE